MSERGQAFTLQGVIGAIILLMAVLVALQALIVTPTTSGTVDADVTNDLRQQANDILITVAENDTFDISTLVRYWDRSDRTFYGALNDRVGYGEQGPPKLFGTLLSETFTERSRFYNIQMQYLPTNETGEFATYPIVYQGEPADHAVVATYTVTLFDRQTLTGPTASDIELQNVDADPFDGDDGYYPIPNAVDGPIYNIVKVRVIVW